MKRFLYSLLCVVMFTTWTNCSTSPTGRRQLILLPESQMAALGEQSFNEIKRTMPLDRDSKRLAYVRCISDAITAAIPADARVRVEKWDVEVFKDDSPNAFALPGGKIGVHTGMLKLAETPGQLAAVMGHEVGHVLARHGAERVSDQLAVQGGLAIGAAALSKDSPSRDIILAGLGLGAQFGLLLPFSRSHESEADAIGLQLMSDAGFDPRQSVELWKNMAKAGGASPPEFLSTHPSSQTRIRQLEEGMGPAMKAYESARAAGRRPQCAL